MHISIPIFNIVWEPGPQKPPVITLRDSAKERKSYAPWSLSILRRLGSRGYRCLLAQGMQLSAHFAGADTGISGPFVEIRGFAAAWQLHRRYQ
jgi:hypothetical protein